MKVQGLNSSSKKTRSLIKKTFAELMNEKKELNKITKHRRAMNEYNKQKCCFTLIACYLLIEH